MFIGIDLGTSGVKVVLTDTKKIIRTATAKYTPIQLNPTWSEQNPHTWYEAVIKTIKKVIYGYEDKIQALSLSGQMHGLVILDKYDEVIRNAILWNDQRTYQEVEYLNQVISKEKLMKYTGNIAVTGLTAPKLLWIKKHEEANFKRISKIMLPKDYIAYRLTGAFYSDPTDMSGTLFYDVKEREYSDEMLSILGIFKEQLPKIAQSHEIIGKIKHSVKKQLRLESDVSVVIGGGDQAMAALGNGVIDDGQFNISLGTSGVVLAVTHKFLLDKHNHFHAFEHVDHKYLIMGVTLAAAGSLSWWKSNFYKNQHISNVFKDVESAKIQDTLYFLPYLSGERAPINDPFAKGTFIGLSLLHTKKEMSRALIEGITYSLRSCYESIVELGLLPNKIRITGGGAKSSTWCQMIADIFGKNIAVLKNAEGGAFGAAIAAMVATSTYDSVQTACSQLIEEEKVVEPNPNAVRMYEEKYQKYLLIYPKLKDIFKVL